MPRGSKRIKLNRISFLVLALSHSRVLHISTLSLHLFLFFSFNCVFAYLSEHNAFFLRFSAK